MSIISKRDIPFLAFTTVTLSLRALPKSLRFTWCESASQKLGTIWYRSTPSDAELTRENIARVLGKQLSLAQIDDTARRLFQNVAYSKLINDLLPDLALSDIQKYLRLEGEQNLKQAMAQGRGAILLIAHYGLHGYSAMALLSQSGYRIIPVVGDEIEPGDSWLYKKVVLPVRRRAEDRLNFEMIKPTGQPQIAMLENLRQNKLLFIYGDVLEETMLGMQPPHVLRAPLLGQELLLKTGPFRLAKGFKTPVLPLFIVPRSNGFALVVEPPLNLSLNSTIASLEADLAAFTQRFEPYLRQDPALWAHWRHEQLRELMQPASTSTLPTPELAHHLVTA
jgi:lauroyl/myristoyl acyltransferase